MSIEERLARVETTTEHISEKVDHIAEKLEDLPCNKYNEEIIKNTGFRKQATGGITVLYTILLGWLAKLFIWK